MNPLPATLRSIVCVNLVLSGCSVLALASSSPHHDSAGSIDPQADEVPSERLQELVWFFRTEDPSLWNYCILGLSVAVLLVGVILLGANMKANRNRKAMILNGETGMTHASLPLKEDEPLEQVAENLLPKIQNAGQVTVQWKDGNVTALYAGLPEEDI